MSFSDVRLHTSRLLLRPLQEPDAAALFSIHSDPVVTRYLSHPPWSLASEADRLIADDRKAMASGDHLRLGIERTKDSCLIGTCSLFNLAAESRRAEIGYVLDSAAWGRGYMGEALERLLAFAFHDLDLNRVEADIDPRNEASARILERFGFRREGLLRERWIVAGEVSDSGLYGLLRSDYLGSR